MMTYATAIQRLSSLAGELQLAPGQAPREFNLSEMRVLADGLRNPQKRFPSILIAGGLTEKDRQLPRWHPFCRHPAVT
jgi:dihydrofolate synthase/folylpolyglutamate synthase